MSETQVITAAASGTITIGGDLTVNRLGYGAMRITGPGIWGPPADKAASLATLRRAIELDVNLIDTADSYGPGTSEELIAEALFPYPADLVIATKGGWERPGPNQWTHNASPKHLTEALEGSLKRLRLDRIDIYQLHAPDNAVSFEASVEALAKLREQGKIRHVALSNVTREHIERARKIVPIVSVQNRYSFADRESDFIVDYCEENDIAFLPWAPLGQGRKADDAIRESRQRTRGHSAASRIGLATQKVQGDSADPWNILGCAFGRKCCGGRVGVAAGSVRRSFRSEPSAGKLARLGNPVAPGRRQCVSGFGAKREDRLRST